MGAPLASVFEPEPDDNASSRTLQFHLGVKPGVRNIAVRGIGADRNEAWYISGKQRFHEDQRFVGFVGSGTGLAEKRR